MHRIAGVIALVVLAVLAAPGGAGAAVNVGELPPDGATYDASTCPPGTGGGAWRLPYPPTYIGAPYEVPPGGGVITRFDTRDIAAPGTPFKFRVVQARVQTGPIAYFVRSLASVPATSATAAGITSVPARIPVAGGELLGITRPPGAGPVLCLFQGTPSDALGYLTSGEPPDGAEVETSASSGYRPNVRAVLEPDGDRDGFGDETQDGCPQVAALSGPCTADLQTSASAAEARIPVGGVGVLTFSVRNAGAATASGVRVAGTLPPGLTLVATTAGGGCIAGALNCAVGDVAAGQTAIVLAVVRATTEGTKTLVANATSSTADPAPGNNAAAGSLIVGPTSLQARLCRVPALRNLSTSAARRALTAAGCRIGKASKPRGRARGRRLRVRTQSIPARTQVVAGTKVDVRLRYVRRR